jgi:hypothetical protein
VIIGLSRFDSCVLVASVPIVVEYWKLPAVKNFSAFGGFVPEYKPAGKREPSLSRRRHNETSMIQNKR